MLRHFLLPLLALTLLGTEATQAQTATAGYLKPAPKKGHMLTARERRAQEATARAQASQAAQTASQPTAQASTPGWSGWSNDPLPETTAAAPHRSTTSLSVAPGMPINQIGHGVSTDYNGRPLTPSVASTTLPNVR